MALSKVEFSLYFYAFQESSKQSYLPNKGQELLFLTQPAGSLAAGREKDYYYVQSTPFIADTVGTSRWCPHQRESVIAGVYFSQTSATCFCRGFSCCPYYRGVRYSGVSARRELTVDALVQCRWKVNSRKKYIRFQKYPDLCGRGLKRHAYTPLTHLPKCTLSFPAFFFLFIGRKPTT